MALIENGRMCIKKYGRDAGSRAVVIRRIDGNFVEVVTAQRTKPRKCNIKHLEFLTATADITDKAAIAKALELEPARSEQIKL
jgi:ribosomal protein L14E/L6E/L27E